MSNSTGTGSPGKILVAGLGKSGIAAAGLALEEGSPVAACDLLPPERLPEAVHALCERGLELHAGTQDPSLLQGVAQVVLSPGVPRETDLVRTAEARGIEVVGELEWAYRRARGRIVAVTGSNGKSTTTTLIARLLSARFPDVREGGNLGTPFTEMLLGATEETRFVLEISSFQLETISTFRADAALLLNITPDHQDRYAAFEDYRDAKGRVFLNQGPADAAIFNAADGLAARFGNGSKAARIPFSSESELPEGAFVRDGKAMWRDGAAERALFALDDLPLPGRHNLENALAASVTAAWCGVPCEAIPGALRSFKGLPHRLELVAEARGVRVYNDSKATNTDSVLKALTAFRGGVILMLGGKDKGADWKSLEPEVRRCCARVVAFGKARAAVEAALSGAVPLDSYPTLKEATPAALACAAPGQSVVLSPACASFDEFQNFEDRGNKFRAWVRAWAGGEAP
jgi:UDP-N-acetylmuramoylalanine--D-glutamate ligase